MFKVDEGSNKNWFAFAMENLNGEGNFASVEIQPWGTDEWFAMQQLWGATYKYDVPEGLNPPFSVRITQIESKQQVVAQNVIPEDWSPGEHYPSLVNFRAILY